MKHIILTLLMPFIFFGCSTQPGENNQQLKGSNDSPKTPFIDPGKFRLLELDTFNLKDWSFGEGEKLQNLTKAEIQKFFQDTNMNMDYVYEENYQYFSLQKNTPGEKIITIVVLYDICCVELHMLTYNNEDKLISDKVVAGMGADGGGGYHQWGCFLNNTTYLMTRVDVAYNSNGEGTTEYSIDSVVTKYSFSNDKPLIELEESKFNRKYTEEEGQ